MDVAVAVGAVLDPTALELADGLAHLGGDRAGLGVGHEAAGPEHPAELADLAHQVGRGDGDVEVEEAALHLLDEVVGAHDVGASLAGLGGRRAGGEHRDSHGLAGARGQRDRAPHDLVGLTGVDAEAHGELDGLVELRTGARLFTRSTASAGA